MVALKVPVKLTVYEKVLFPPKLPVKPPVVDSVPEGVIGDPPDEERYHRVPVNGELLPQPEQIQEMFTERVTVAVPQALAPVEPEGEHAVLCAYKADEQTDTNTINKRNRVIN